MYAIPSSSTAFSQLRSIEPRLKWPCRLACLAAALAATLPLEAAAENYALVVAVRDYPGCQSLPSLMGVNRDAVRLRQVLESAGFQKRNIEVVYDEARDAARQPTRRNILSRLDATLANKRREDLVLVVTTTHGLVFNNRSYLCPADTTDRAIGSGAAAQRSLVAVSDITKRMSRCRAENKVLVVDACRDASRSRRRGFVKSLQTPPTGLWLMSSCSEEEFSWVSKALGDGESHAVFTYFLCEGLGGAADTVANNDGEVTVTELYAYTYAKTLQEVVRMGEQQSPELFGGVAPLFSVARAKPVTGRRLRSSDPVLAQRQSAESLADRGNERVRAAEAHFIKGYRQFAQTAVRGYRVDDEKLYRDYHRQICYALGNYLTPALDFDPGCKKAHLARAWCYRASGMYEEALDAFRQADENLDLYVKGSPAALDQYIERKANGQATLARKKGNRPPSSGPVLPLLEKPDVRSPSVANVSAFSKVRIGRVHGDRWVLVTAVDDNPLPDHGWVRRDNVVWFAEASQVYTPASPMLAQTGYGGGAMALSRLDYASQNLYELADRLETPINNVESVVSQVQSIPFLGSYVPSIPYLSYGRIPARAVRTAGSYASIPSSYINAASGWAGAAQGYQHGLQRAQQVERRRAQLLQAKSLEPVTEKPLELDTSLWRDTSLLAARATDGE